MSILELMKQFPEALAAGTLMAVACSVFGVYVILKRVVFIGITLSEVATCGIALAFLLGLPPFAGAAVLTLLAVGVLSAPFEARRIPRDAVLGFMFVLAGAGAVLMVSHSGMGLMEIKALLYGDLILANPSDLRVVAVVLGPLLLLFLAFQRPLLNAFLDRDAFLVMGGWPRLWEVGFFAGLGLMVSAASRTGGALLVFCYLTVPPMTALLCSQRMEWVLAISALAAVAATWGGMGLSFILDWPTNQTICLASCALAAMAWIARGVHDTASRVRISRAAVSCRISSARRRIPFSRFFRRPGPGFGGRPPLPGR